MVTLIDDIPSCQELVERIVADAEAVCMCVCKHTHVDVLAREWVRTLERTMHCRGMPLCCSGGVGYGVSCLSVSHLGWPSDADRPVPVQVYVRPLSKRMLACIHTLVLVWMDPCGWTGR